MRVTAAALCEIIRLEDMKMATVASVQKVQEIPNKPHQPSVSYKFSKQSLMNVHKEKTHKLDLKNVLNNFVAQSEHRTSILASINYLNTTKTLLRTL